MVFELHITDPSVQASVISAVGGILSALIASLAAALVGRQIAGRKRLQAALQLAVADVQFLLAVEHEHCEMHREFSEETFKQRVRQLARDKGHEWSGRFTPGRARTMSILNGDN